METITGKVYAVSTHPAGADVVAISSGTPTVLTLDDAVDFEESGGTVLIEGVPFTYTEADLEADTLTVDFATPLAEQAAAMSALEVGERVLLSPLAPETRALVVIDDGEEPLDARVPHALTSLFADGVREDEEAETVTLTLEGSEWVIGDVVGRPSVSVHGDPDGRAVEISEDGINAWDVDEDNNRLLMWSLSSTGADSFLLRDAEGETTAVIDSTGHITANGADFGESLTVAGTPLFDVNTPPELTGVAETWLDALPRGVIARQNFSVGSSAARATGEEWGYCKIGFTAKPNRTYRITADFGYTNGSTTGQTRMRFRYTDDGTQPTIASPMLGEPTTGALAYTPSLALNSVNEVFYGTVSAERTVSVLLTYQGLGNATPRARNAMFTVEDVGPRGTYGASGSYSDGGQVPGGTSNPLPDSGTVQTYTSVWRANDSRVYDGSGGPTGDSDLVQGYYSSAQGHRRSAVIFTGGAVTGEVGKTITSALSGATLTKAEVFLRFNHWYNASGGTARIGKLGYTSLPSTLSDAQIDGSTISSSGWRRGASRWVTVPVSWFSDSNRGFRIGGGSSTYSEYFGRAESHRASLSYYRPAVRLTYTR